MEAKLSVNSKTLCQVVREIKEDISSGTLPSEMHLRRVWAGVFRNPEESLKEECLDLIRRSIDNASSMGLEKILGMTFNSWRIKVPPSNLVDGLFDPETSPLLAFEKGEVVVIPNLIGGIPLCCIAINAMRSIGRDPAGFSIAGYSKNGDTKFEDGGDMGGKVYIPGSEAENVAQNFEGKKALLVDDTENIGVSLRILKIGIASRMKFSKIFKLTDKGLGKVD